LGAAGHTIVLRYPEIGARGRNRPFFVRRLVENVERATAGLPVGRVRRAAARLLLPLADTAAWPAVRERLARVFGVVNFALANQHALATRAGDAAAELVRLGEAIVARLEGVALPSFRVRTKRSDKRFALTSPEVNTVLGRMIQASTGATVDLDAAALTVAVDILPGRAFFSLEKVPGAGGLPVGSSGRVLALLSGGIDSPVAAWRMMRRGCRVDLVHFHSVPFLDRTSQEKARELGRLLAAWGLEADLYLVPFGEGQRQIVAAVGRPLRVVLYRRMMLRIAAALARGAERGGRARGAPRRDRAGGAGGGRDGAGASTRRRRARRRAYARRGARAARSTARVARASGTGAPASTPRCRPRRRGRRASCARGARGARWWARRPRPSAPTRRGRRAARPREGDPARRAARRRGASGDQRAAGASTFEKNP